MKGGGEHPLTVAVRIRPMSEAEIAGGGSQVAYRMDDQMAVLLDPSDDPDDILRANRSREKRYVFHSVFDATSTQEEVYRATTRFLIDSVISGYNGTVFAYGATGAGKTYTMLGTEYEPGIYVRTLNDLFTLVQEKEADMSHQVSMSYLEIYNEMVRDLLNPSSGYLEMREDAKGGVQVSGLSEISTTSTGEIMELLQRGNRERTQEPTKANKTSSRSHAVLQVTVKQRSRGGHHFQRGGGVGAAATAANVHDQLRVGRLFLVDLAGSERAANTQNRGKRMVEGAHINRSLLALGNCINALSEMKGGATSYKYVNYRDSKLTRLLKDALGGNCRTVMIAHVAPASMHFEESRNTLVYADRAKFIKNKVRRNVEDVSYHLTQYTSIITELKDEISRLQAKLAASAASGALRPTASIVAVQDEVLRTSHAHEFFKLKEQLMFVFNEQLELRRNLMELQNASVEIAFEADRHQLTVAEWEAECSADKKRRERDSDSGLDKDLEVSGESHDDGPEPEEVRAARQELAVLAGEQQRLNKKRARADKELAVVRQKAVALEENLPKYVSSEEHREIVKLLLRVHELEIDNTKVQSELYLKEVDGNRKDSLLSQYQSHRVLADDIIAQQKQLIQDHSVPVPAELQRAYDAMAALPLRVALAEAEQQRSAAGSSLVSIQLQPNAAQQQQQQLSLPSSNLRLPPIAPAQTAAVKAAAADGEDEEERWARYQRRDGRRPLGIERQPHLSSVLSSNANAAASQRLDAAQAAANRRAPVARATDQRRLKRDDHFEFEQRRAIPVIVHKSGAPSSGSGALYTLPKERTLYSLSIRSSSDESLVGATAGSNDPRSEAAATSREAPGTRGIAARAAARRQHQHEQQQLAQQEHKRLQLPPSVVVRIDDSSADAASGSMAHVTYSGDAGSAAASLQQPPPQRAAAAAAAPPPPLPLLSISDGYLNRTFISVSSAGDAASVRSDVRTPASLARPLVSSRAGVQADGGRDGVATVHDPATTYARPAPPPQPPIRGSDTTDWRATRTNAGGARENASRDARGLPEDSFAPPTQYDSRSGGQQPLSQQRQQLHRPPTLGRRAASGRHRRRSSVTDSDPRQARPSVLNRHPSGNVTRKQRSARRRRLVAAQQRINKASSPSAATAAMTIVASRPPVELRAIGRSRQPTRAAATGSVGKKPTAATAAATSTVRAPGPVPYRSLLREAAPVPRSRLLQLQQH